VASKREAAAATQLACALTHPAARVTRLCRDPYFDALRTIPDTVRHAREMMTEDESGNTRFELVRKCRTTFFQGELAT
jgi:hypothetical protein